MRFLIAKPWYTGSSSCSRLHEGLRLRVWHTPVNYGSLPSNSVRLLRAVGVDAHGLFYTSSVMRSDEGVKVVVGAPARRSAALLLSRLRWMSAWLRELLALRPDVIHWYFGRAALPFGVDLLLVRRLRIPRIVEWQGSDIRTPQVERDNPYYAAALSQGYEYAAAESEANAVARQRRFASAGFASAAPVGMLQYVRTAYFPHTHTIRQRLLLSDYVPHYPRADAQPPLIVHMSTAPGAKGTAAVLRAVEKLQTTHRFTFRLVQGVSRDEAYAVLRQADIVLDQFVLGDFGMASLEGLAFGKPVVCYIKPSLLSQYPPDLPIRSATQDNLADVLASLIEQPAQLRALGEASRAYMERHYQPDDLAAELTTMYRQVIIAQQQRGDHAP